MKLMNNIEGSNIVFLLKTSGFETNYMYAVIAVRVKSASVSEHYKLVKRFIFLEPRGLF